ncbi:MAG: sigma-70 family RNA polymerase sigma factor [Eubacteriales bacterium]
MDEQNTEIAYQRYGSNLYRLSYMMLQDKHDAEDVVQEVFIKYMMKSPVFNSEEHEKAWLLRVCSNICKNRIRFRIFHKTLSLEEVNLIDDNSVYQDTLSELLDLPVKYREVFVLHYVEGYKCNEVGKILNVTEVAVKKRLERGRLILRKEKDK